MSPCHCSSRWPSWGWSPRAVRPRQEKRSSLLLLSWSYRAWVRHGLPPFSVITAHGLPRCSPTSVVMPQPIILPSLGERHPSCFVTSALWWHPLSCPPLCDALGSSAAVLRAPAQQPDAISTLRAPRPFGSPDHPLPLATTATIRYLARARICTSPLPSRRRLKLQGTSLTNGCRGITRTPPGKAPSPAPQLQGVLQGFLQGVLVFTGYPEGVECCIERDDPALVSVPLTR